MRATEKKLNIKHVWSMCGLLYQINQSDLQSTGAETVNSSLSFVKWRWKKTEVSLDTLLSIFINIFTRLPKMSVLCSGFMYLSMFLTSTTTSSLSFNRFRWSFLKKIGSKLPVKNLNWSMLWQGEERCKITVLL